MFEKQTFDEFSAKSYQTLFMPKTHTQTTIMGIRMND